MAVSSSNRKNQNNQENGMENISVLMSQIWGAMFLWIDPNNPQAKERARTICSAFEKDTNYFDPSSKPFMLNYRVENLVELLKVLRGEGVTVIDKIEELSYGKFGWIMDPSGEQ